MAMKPEDVLKAIAAAQRVDRRVEAGVLDHENHRLAAHIEPGRDRRGLVLGGARHHADGFFLVERGEHGLLVRVGDAEDPAEVIVDRRLRDLGGQGGSGLAERVLQRVDDERCGNRLGHTCPPWGPILPEASTIKQTA